MTHSPETRRAIASMAREGKNDIEIAQSLGLTRAGVRSVRRRLGIASCAKSGSQRYDWASVDWSQSNAEIAGRLGCHKTAVGLRRKAINVSKLKSKREDKRGHWPRGKRRNAPPKDWPQVRNKLARLLVSPDRGPISDEFVRSLRGLARWLKVSVRQVRRWLSSEDMPSVERVERLKKWMSHWG